MKEKENPDKKSYFYYAGIGVDLVVHTVVGGLVGYLLDKKFDTMPIFLLIFTVLGTASGFLNVFKLLNRDKEGGNR
ncbi:MAG: AtpZ/AtpI family protein [Actinobacteria bacterium]|nr:AtpZ/AtpI family protein [Actinomycetota bacterium]